MAKDIKDLDKDLKQLQKQLEKTFDKNVKTVYNKIGKEITSSIKDRWIDGQGVEKHGAKQSALKELAESTIKNRKYKQKKGKLDKRTKPEKSNLIDSGKTINQLHFNSKKDELIIGVKNREEIIGYQEENNRKILYLSSEETQVVDNIINKEIEDILKKL